MLHLVKELLFGLDFSEWHTIASSFALMLIHPGAWLVVTVKLAIEEKRRYGSFAEYRQEFPYWLTTGLVTGLSVVYIGELEPLLSLPRLGMPIWGVIG